MTNKKRKWTLFAVSTLMAMAFVLAAIGPVQTAWAQTVGGNNQQNQDQSQVIPNQPTFNIVAEVIPALNEVTGLRFNKSHIQVVGVSQVNFQDDCLNLVGVRTYNGNEYNTQACGNGQTTPGYRIVVSALGETYVLNTNRDASRIRVVPPQLTTSGAQGSQAQGQVPVTGGDAQGQATATPATGDAQVTPQPTTTEAAGGDDAGQATATPATGGTGSGSGTGSGASGSGTGTGSGTTNQGSPSGQGVAGSTGTTASIQPIPQQPTFNPIAEILPVLNELTGLRFNNKSAQVVSVSQVNFFDSCLGLPNRGTYAGNEFNTGACGASGDHAGYRVGVVANGSFYVFHTNRDASVIRVVPPGLTAAQAGSAVPATGDQGAAGGQGNAYTGMLNSFRPAAIPSQPTFDVKAAVMTKLNEEMGWRLNTGDIELAGVSQINWTDACLGLAGIDGQGFNCAAVSTPGYRIAARVLGSLYVIHTDADGYHVRLVPPGLTAGQGSGQGDNQDTGG
jgi:hypothetical protein